MLVLYIGFRVGVQHFLHRILLCHARVTFHGSRSATLAGCNGVDQRHSVHARLVVNAGGAICDSVALVQRVFECCGDAPTWQGLGVTLGPVI